METLYTSTDKICSDIFSGTREEWETGLKDSMRIWYQEYVQTVEDTNKYETETDKTATLTFEEYETKTLDGNLIEIFEDDDTDYASVAE